MNVLIKRIANLNTLIRFLKKSQEVMFGFIKLSTRFIYFEVDGSMPRIKGTSN